LARKSVWLIMLVDALGEVGKSQHAEKFGFAQVF
jgi:hypothetical protein